MKMVNLWGYMLVRLSPQRNITRPLMVSANRRHSALMKSPFGLHIVLHYEAV